MAKKKTAGKKAAKKQAGGKKKGKAAKKHQVVALTAATAGYFVKIVSCTFAPASDDLTVTAVCGFPAGTMNLGATITAIDASDGSTLSGTATFTPNATSGNTGTITGTINLSNNSVYVVEVSLVDTSTTPPTVRASDSVIYSTANDTIGVQNAVVIGPLAAAH